MENLTHWKKAFKSDYLSSSDIDDKDLSLTIARVEYKECVTQSGKKFCNVAYFTDTKLDQKGKCISGTKPMILNVTNSKLVKKFSGNKTHLQHWQNITVQIYVDPSVKFGSDTVEGLRIRQTQPKLKSNLTPLTEDKLNDAVVFIGKGKTITDLKKFYSITPDIEAKLKALLDEA